ncbi:MAG TPA: CHAP domain-containing protein [Terricaulis sp.]|nr:CHAP domain-containing protein [Terricaulis sp.]
MAAALTACASTPAPVYPGLRGRAPVQADAPPFNPNAPPHIADARANLQCVPFARRESGIELYGDANTWWAKAEGRYPRSAYPASGAVLVVEGYYGPGRGHVAVVREVIDARILRVDHANWLNNGEISLGVPVLDVSPHNDWSQIRVWHIPGGHWGGRVYRVEGFIHPFALTAMTG